MGLSRTVSEKNDNFSRIFTPPCILRPADRVPLELGISATRSLTISSAMWIQFTDVPDGRTNRRTDAGRQQRPRLHIAYVARVKTRQLRQALVSTSTDFNMIILTNIISMLSKAMVTDQIQGLDNARPNVEWPYMEGDNDGSFHVC